MCILCLQQLTGDATPHYVTIVVHLFANLFLFTCTYYCLCRKNSIAKKSHWCRGKFRYYSFPL